MRGGGLGGGELVMMLGCGCGFLLLLAAGGAAWYFMRRKPKGPDQPG